MKHTNNDIRNRLHTVESAGEFLGGVSPYTIRNWLSSGKLTRVKIGRLTRVRESELLDLITEQNYVHSSKPLPLKGTSGKVIA